MCPLEEKQLLIEAAPDIYFETDHYRGWPSVLVRIRLISEEGLIPASIARGGCKRRRRL